MMKKDLQQLFDEFMFEAEFVRKARPKTLKGYRHTFSLFFKIQPDVTIQTLEPATISQFFKILHVRKRIVGKGIVKVGITKSTVATYWGKLSAFFRWLETRGYIQENPFRQMVCPTPSYDDIKYLKKEEVEKIFAAIHNHSSSILLLKRNLVIFYILLFCGLRREELILLQIRDIDFERKTITVRADTSKSNKTRYLPLHSTTILHLKDYLQERRRYSTPYLIVSGTRDDRFSSDGMQHLIATLCKYSDVRFHLHQLRHTFAVNFLLSSNNLVKLQQLLGHKSILTTTVYLRSLPVDKIKGDIQKLSIDDLI